MDNTIIAFPQEGTRNGNKVAKLSTAKRDSISNKYYSQIASVETKEEAKPDNTKTLNNSNSILDNVSVSDNDFASSLTFSGTRKLKVNNVVEDKSRAYYKRNYPEVKKEEAPVVPTVAPVEEAPQEQQENVSLAADTRVSRLERTGEINKIDLKEAAPQVNNVINAPERFQEKPVVNPYESLINDKENIPLTREAVREDENKNQEQNMGGDPNLYTKLVHGKDEAFGDSEISTKLQDAISKLGVANEEREKAKAVNASLEREVASVREVLEKLRKEKDAQEQKVLENTLSMLKDAKAEILDETRRYDNLQEELQALIKERDALLKNPFINNEDDKYSSKRAA